MRSLAMLLLLSFAAAPAFAMDSSQIDWYAHGDVALPMGDFGDVAGTGFGGGIRGAMPYSEVLTLRGEVGYIHFGGESFGDWDYQYALIPFVVLAEYQFTSGSPVYGLGGLGMTMARFSYEWYNPWTDEDEDDTDSDTEFGIHVGGGYHLNEQMTVEGRYNIVSDLDYLSVHFLYNF